MPTIFRPLILILSLSLLSFLSACGADQASSEARLSLELSPAQAKAVLKKRGGEASIAPAASAALGEKTRLSYDLEPATYALDVSAEGYAPLGRTVILSEAETKTLSVALEPLTNEPLKAVYRATPSRGSSPLNVSFVAQGSAGATRYRWTFGDGSSAEGARVEHTFTSKGSFETVLEVANAQGETATTSDFIYVDVTPPSAAFSATPASDVAPARVSFDAGASSAVGADLKSYRWDFGDGNLASGVQVEHTFATYGSYDVVLTVTDSNGTQALSRQTLLINGAPEPVFSASSLVGEPPLEVSFDASASADPDGTIESYTWDFGDGTAARGAQVTHRFDTAGTFNVSLSVTDDRGAGASASQSVTANLPPVAAWLTEAGAQAFEVAFDGALSSDPDGEIENYTWTFGDGSSAQGAAPTHRFASGGEYTVSLSVTDTFGATGTETRTILVREDGVSLPPVRLKPITVSADKHGFEAGGEPFFWLADTAWALFSATKAEDIPLYMDDAKAKGFSVIQIFLTTVWTDYGENGENFFGNAPFIDNDPTRLNPAYFSYVEWVINEAAKRGLYVALVYGEPGWVREVPYSITSIEEGYRYANALGKRFAAQTRANNLLWLNGQDRGGERYFGTEGWLAMNEGLADGINGVTAYDGQADYSTSLMSHHTGGCCSSSKWFHADAFLDFNVINTWKRYFYIVELALGDYALEPTKPTVCIENAYQNIDLDGEFRDAWHVRFQGYWCVLSGSAGYAYGHIPGYRFRSDRAWPRFLDVKSRLQMIHLKSVITSKPVNERVPDQSLVVSDPGSATKPKDYIAAARGRDGAYAFVYSTQGDTFTLDLSKLAGTRVSAQWFNPREGTYQPLGTFDKTTAQVFDPPGEPGPDNDWLLVLDAQ